MTKNQFIEQAKKLGFSLTEHTAFGGSYVCLSYPSWKRDRIGVFLPDRPYIEITDSAYEEFGYPKGNRFKAVYEDEVGYITIEVPDVISYDSIGYFDNRFEIVVSNEGGTKKIEIPYRRKSNGS